MGCRILGNDNEACFYDSVTMTCFGKVMDGIEEAEGFQLFVKKDLRLLTDSEFEKKLDDFRYRRRREKK